jgi:hypothetical protein
MQSEHAPFRLAVKTIFWMHLAPFSQFLLHVHDYTFFAIKNTTKKEIEFAMGFSCG